MSGQLNGRMSTYSEPYHDTVWIITGKKELNTLFQKQKFDFTLDTRLTLISNTTARLAGLRMGIEYRRVHRFGIGLYGLGNGVHMSSLREINPNINDAVLNLSYASVFYERVLYFHPKWEWSATVHVGKGEINGKYRTANNQLWQALPSRSVNPFEISTTGYYHLTWWCSLGFGYGYRFMSNTPMEVRPVYNAPVAIARLRIKVGRLVKNIWDKDVRLEY